METAERIDTVLPGSAQHQIEALRTAIDVRLAALEAILADPTRGDSLEAVILDLSRLAAEEAHASAVRECVGIKLEADTEIAQIRKTLQAALEQERTGAAHLRQGLERADQRLATLERERAAELRAAQARFDAALAGERTAGSELKRSAAALEQQLTEIRQRFESERTVVTGLRQSVERAEDTLSTTKRELEEARASRDASRESLTAELSRERELRARLENVHAQTQEALDGERAAHADLRQSALRLEQERKSFNLRDHELRGAHDALAAEFADVRQRRDALTSELADLRKRHDAATTELTGLRQRHDAATSELTGLRQRHDAATSEVANDHQRREALASQLADQNRRGETLSTQLADERQRVNALTSQLADGQKRVEDLQQANNQVEAQMAAERAEVAHWLQRLKEADDRVRMLTRQRSDDQAAHDRLVATLDEERQVRSDLQESRDDLLMQLEASRAALAELRHALERTEHRLSQETTDTATQSAGHEELQRALAAANAEARTLKGERDALRAEIDTIRRHQEATRTEVAALQTEQEALRTDLDSTRAELDAARSDREESQRQVAVLEADLQLSRGDVEQMQGTLQASRAELEIALADLTLSRTEIDELIAARQNLERTQQVLEERLSAVAREPAVSSTTSTQVPAALPETAPALIDAAPLYVASTPTAAAKADPDGWVPIPLATRYSFPEHIEIRVNGGAGLLCDLSATGCQLLLSSALKPNLTVKLVFPSEAMPIACTGKVVWAQIEPPAPGRPLYYRAGVKFTKADAAEIEAFIARRNR